MGIEHNRIGKFIKDENGQVIKVSDNGQIELDFDENKKFIDTTKVDADKESLFDLIFSDSNISDEKDSAEDSAEDLVKESEEAFDIKEELSVDELEELKETDLAEYSRMMELLAQRELAEHNKELDEIIKEDEMESRKQELDELYKKPTSREGRRDDYLYGRD